MFVDSRKSSIVFEGDPSTYEYNICKLERLTDMLIGGKLFQCLIISVIYYQNTHIHTHKHILIHIETVIVIVLSYRLSEMIEKVEREK